MMLKQREIKPLPLDEYKFVVPDIQKFTLSSGLNVMLVERHTLPIIRINLMSDCGSKLDPYGKKGLANLFAMLLDEGAGNYDALQISNEFDLLGSDFDIHCTNDSIYFLSRSLKENFGRTIELFSSVVRTPHLKEEEFHKEKRKVQTRMIQIHDDPDEIASNAFEYLMFNREHPYAFPVLGMEKNLLNINITDIRDFYKTCFCPSCSDLVLVGDISRNSAEDLLEKYFSDWQNVHKQNNNFAAVSSVSPGIYFINKPGAVQTEIRVGHLTEKRNPENYFSRLLLNMVLGGQFSSRINLNLRENKGYTYGAFSNFSFSKDAGYFYVSTSVGKENTANALTEIQKELNMIKEGVTEEELTFAKTSMMRKFPSNFETNGQIASSLSRMVLYDLPDNHFKNYLQTIHDISLNQVNKSASDYIFPDDLIILLVGDKEDILQQFKGELTELNIEGEQISS